MYSLFALIVVLCSGVYRYHGQRYWNRTADCRFQPQQRSSTSMPATGSRANGGNGKKRPSAASSAILVRDQRRMCQRNLELMSTVVHAARVAIDVCQMQFRDSRWNCSSSLSAPHLTPDLTSGTFLCSLSRACRLSRLLQSITLIEPRGIPLIRPTVQRIFRMRNC